MRSNLFAKLVGVLLAAGACGCALLAVRQARMQAAHELAESRLRILELEQRLQLVRAEVAAHLHPEEIEQLAAHSGRFRPLAATRDTPPRDTEPGG